MSRSDGPEGVAAMDGGHKKGHSIEWPFLSIWLREPDLNRRPSGYEPDELPDCSIPRSQL
jgi:hypothetical protein